MSTDPQIMQFSTSGKYLLVTHRLWELTGDSPKLIWTYPEERDRSVQLLGLHTRPNHNSGGIFPDEKHVAMIRDAQLQIWDWTTDTKLATLYFLPDGGWAWVNHHTGHWTSSPLAFQYLRCLSRDTEGKDEWLTEVEYAKRTGWKNDPEKAGLDLEKRNRELVEKAKAD